MAINYLSTKEDFEIVSIFLKLKGLTNCGCIKNYRKKYVFIGEKFSLSEHTVRKKISKLKELGLVTIDNGNLYLKSKSHLLDWLGYEHKYGLETKDVNLNNVKISKDFIYNCNNLSNNNVDRHNVKYYNVNDEYVKNKQVKDNLKLLLYSLKIDNNINQQKEAYIGKHIERESGIKLTENKKEELKKPLKKIRRNVCKNFDKLVKGDFNSVDLLFDNLIEVNIKGSKLKKVQEFINSDRNCRFTVSRYKIAKLSGFKTKKTGTNIVNKMKKLNLIEVDSAKEIKLNDNGILLEEAKSNEMIAKYGNIYYSTKRDSTIIRLANKVCFNKDLIYFNNDKGLLID